MAQIEDSSGGREVNVEPNLVPFIDLMSVCIIFLLVTAVWTQVSMIELGASVYGKKVGEESLPPPTSQIEIIVKVNANGYIITEGKRSYSIKKQEGEYDLQALYDQLKLVKSRNPNQSLATISLDNDLKYNEMVEGMDVMLNSGFSEVSVRTQ